MKAIFASDSYLALIEFLWQWYNISNNRTTSSASLKRKVWIHPWNKLLIKTQTQRHTHTHTHRHIIKYIWNTVNSLCQSHLLWRVSFTRYYLPSCSKGLRRTFVRQTNPTFLYSFGATPSLKQVAWSVADNLISFIFLFASLLSHIARSICPSIVHKSKMNTLNIFYATLCICNANPDETRYTNSYRCIIRL